MEGLTNEALICRQAEAEAALLGFTPRLCARLAHRLPKVTGWAFGLTDRDPDPLAQCRIQYGWAQTDPYQLAVGAAIDAVIDELVTGLPRHAGWRPGQRAQQELLLCTGPNGVWVRYQEPQIGYPCLQVSVGYRIG